MAEYIEREAVITSLRKEAKQLIDDIPNLINPQDRIENVCVKVGVDIATDIIKAIPAAEVAPVKRGKWIEDGYNDEPYVCSECGEPCTSFCMEKPRWRYCPWCGAKIEDAADV